jgi:hypothetical protein
MITYTGSTLRIDCNEIGFSRKNVEAICKIGRSTKTGLGNETRYIGEKGIGFKSVFKVADVAWILSGYYSFKFDKGATLGMIAPVWATFPEARLHGYTSILLEMSESYNPRDLINDLHYLDPKLLIFLRNLRQINIRSCSTQKTFSRSLGSQELEPEKDGLTRISLLCNSERSKFKTTRFSVVNIPPDLRRPGVSSSEILLGFPVADNGLPEIHSQSVYAILPIRDYGFKVGLAVNL